MKKLPILFSAPMVRAILEGRKTQTRRLQTKAQPGDVLWVRETWHRIEETELTPKRYVYRADYEDGKRKFMLGGIWYETPTSWKPSIFMPFKVCRLFLKVKAVRRERLEDIEAGDIYKEGVPYHSCEKGLNTKMFNDFANLWDSLHNKPGERWEDNPEVSVIEFSMIENFNTEAKNERD